MLANSLLTISIITLTVLVTNVVQGLIWCWVLKRRELYWASQRSELEAQRRLQELAYQTAAHRFEREFQRINTGQFEDLIQLMQLWKEECHHPSTFSAHICKEAHLIQSLGDKTPVLTLEPTGRLLISQANQNKSGPFVLEPADFKFEPSSEEPEQLWAFPVESPHCNWLIVSHLPQFSQNERLTLQIITRCLGMLAPATSVIQKSLANSDEHELRLIRDMLQLRSLTDIEFTSPEELLEEFLNRLSTLSGFDIASIFFQSSENEVSAELYSWGGRRFFQENAAEWNRMELKLATHCQNLARITWLDANGLQEILGPECLVSTVLIVPLKHVSQENGVLLLTSREKITPTQVTEQLAEWAAQFLLNSFEKAMSLKLIQDRARRDGLTGLSNRFTFDNEFPKILAACHASKSPCSLLLIDIDHFKKINDRYGHLSGDEALRRAAQVILQTLQQQQRAVDRPLVARYGGEEFAIVLPECPSSAAKRIAESIRMQFINTVLLVNGQTLQMTASIGVASCPPAYDSTQLLQMADDALYQAKWEGRNRTVVANSQIEDSGMHQTI